VAVNETLASFSNTLVYSAMIVYTGALGAFAVDLSGRGKVVDRTATAGRPGKVPAVVGGAREAELTESLVAESAAARAGNGSGTPTAADGGAVAGHSKAGGIAVSLTWLALLLHLGGVVARGVSVQRAPWGNMYEFAITGSVVVTAVFMLTLLRRDLRYLGTFVVGPVLLTLGAAVSAFYVPASPLVPALHSFWLIIHVSVAFVASALFTLAFSTTVLQLVQERRELRRAAGRPATRGAFMDRLPGSVDLERSAYRMHVVAFPLWTFTVIAGAIWAEAAWGKYWNWDPKEVWSFVIWVVYAGYLHARVTRGWDGRRAAYLALAGYACLLFNFLVVNVFFVGMHSYAGV